MPGAIVEHLSGPAYAISAWARLAREAVLVLFTDVLPIGSLEMRTITPLDNPDIFYIWWHLSRRLYTKLFDKLGFDVHFTLAEAIHNNDVRGATTAQRPSIIATRRAATRAQGGVRLSKDDDARSGRRAGSGLRYDALDRL